MQTKRKTALVLSGGGSRGAYQAGAWQAIQELGIKLDMVVGVSVGALNGAMVVQGDPIKTANLWRQMETDMIFDVASDATLPDFAKEFFANGGAGSTGLQKIVNQYADEEIIRKSPIDFGLVTVEFPSRKPYYLWKEDIPEGKIADYVTASASAFPAIQTYEIDGKEFIDGGYANNLPVSMALEHGATDVIAVYLDAVGKFYPEELDQVENLVYIKPKWELGDFLVFSRENSRKIIRLGYLDAMKAFDIYEGEYYTFVKGAFDKRQLKQADMAAKLFEMDPEILYRKDFFIQELTDKVDSVTADIAARHAGSFDFNMSLRPDKLKEHFKDFNRKSIALVIAHNLANKGQDSIFNAGYIQKFIKNEVAVAKFLVNNGIIFKEV